MIERIISACVRNRVVVLILTGAITGWGVWAMLAPSAWVPARLPHWGALLGLGIGVVVLLVFNAPQRVFYLHFPIEARVGGILLIGGFYYLLWLLVRRVYLAMEAHSAATPTHQPM